MSQIPFGAFDIDEILAAEPERAEELPFGAVLIDRAGRVVRYNKAAGLIAGHAPEAAIGMNFFSDVVPGAGTGQLVPAFEKFCESGRVNARIDHKMAYKSAEIRLRIHLKSAPDARGCWVFLRRI